MVYDNAGVLRFLNPDTRLDKTTGSVTPGNQETDPTAEVGAITDDWLKFHTGHIFSREPHTGNDRDTLQNLVDRARDQHAQGHYTGNVQVYIDQDIKFVAGDAYLDLRGVDLFPISYRGVTITEERDDSDYMFRLRDAARLGAFNIDATASESRNKWYIWGNGDYCQVIGLKFTGVAKWDSVHAIYMNNLSHGLVSGCQVDNVFSCITTGNCSDTTVTHCNISGYSNKGITNSLGSTAGSNCYRNKYIDIQIGHPATIEQEPAGNPEDIGLPGETYARQPFAFNTGNAANKFYDCLIEDVHCDLPGGAHDGSTAGRETASNTTADSISIHNAINTWCIRCSSRGSGELAFNFSLGCKNCGWIICYAEGADLSSFSVGVLGDADEDNANYIGRCEDISCISCQAVDSTLNDLEITYQGISEFGDVWFTAVNRPVVRGFIGNRGSSLNAAVGVIFHGCEDIVEEGTELHGNYSEKIKYYDLPTYTNPSGIQGNTTRQCSIDQLDDIADCPVISEGYDNAKRKIWLRTPEIFAHYRPAYRHHTNDPTPLLSGDRTALITPSIEGNADQWGSTTIDTLVNGLTGNDGTSSWASASDFTVDSSTRFVIQLPYAASLSAIEAQGNRTDDHGIWRAVGSHDGTNWTPLTDLQTWISGGTTWSFPTNDVAYLYYGIEGDSGTFSRLAYVYEFLFTAGLAPIIPGKWEAELPNNYPDDWMNTLIIDGDGNITVTATHPEHAYIVSTDGAATKDLTGIVGGQRGQKITLVSEVVGETVVVKDGGNMLLDAGDFSLDHTQDTIQLRTTGIGESAIELFRKNIA